MDQRLWVAYQTVRNVQQTARSSRATRSQRARVRDMVGRGAMPIAKDRRALSTQHRYVLVDHERAAHTRRRPAMAERLRALVQHDVSTSATAKRHSILQTRRVVLGSNSTRPVRASVHDCMATHSVVRRDVLFAAGEHPGRADERRALRGHQEQRTLPVDVTTGRCAGLSRSRRLGGRGRAGRGQSDRLAGNQAAPTMCGLWG